VHGMSKHVYGFTGNTLEGAVFQPLAQCLSGHPTLKPERSRRAAPLPVRQCRRFA
jgi:hypothetical protein